MEKPGKIFLVIGQIFHVAHFSSYLYADVTTLSNPALHHVKHIRLWLPHFIDKPILQITPPVHLEG